MKAAIYKGIKQMACEERPKPTIIDDGDAIIRVVRACVCGSDLWFYRDGREADTQTGHEAIGVVESVGDDVTIAKPGDTAVVFGDGAVGLCAVLSAKLMGASRIISMSRHADRQGIARKFGATDFVEERGDEAVAKVLEMTDGYGADAVLECVGSALSNDTAMKVARAGAVVGRVGLPHDVEVDIPGLFYRNVGLRGGPAPVRTYDMQRLLKEVLDGTINPGIVYTSEYTLDDIQEAYAAMDERRTVKSLLRISEV